MINEIEYKSAMRILKRLTNRYKVVIDEDSQEYTNLYIYIIEILNSDRIWQRKYQRIWTAVKYRCIKASKQKDIIPIQFEQLNDDEYYNNEQDSAEDLLFREYVIEVLDNILTPREQRCVKMYYGFEDGCYTLREISEYYDVPINRVRIYLNRGIRKLRKCVNCRELLYN